MRLTEVVRTELEKSLIRLNIQNYHIREDGLVDVKGDVDCSNTDFRKLPIKFGKVDGNFDCGRNSNLITLEGSPEWVGGWFSCYLCSKLKSLKGGPKKVLGNFYCHNNSSLESLDYLPKEFGTISGGQLHLLNVPKVKDYLKIFDIKNIESVVLDEERSKLSKILNKYLPKRDMLNCQDELIEAGLEEYAEID